MCERWRFLLSDYLGSEGKFIQRLIHQVCLIIHTYNYKDWYKDIKVIFVLIFQIVYQGCFRMVLSCFKSQFGRLVRSISIQFMVENETRCARTATDVLSQARHCHAIGSYFGGGEGKQGAAKRTTRLCAAHWKEKRKVFERQDPVAEKSSQIQSSTFTKHLCWEIQRMLPNPGGAIELTCGRRLSKRRREWFKHRKQLHMSWIAMLEPN